jgi:uncharacterized protein HemY
LQQEYTGAEKIFVEKLIYIAKTNIFLQVFLKYYHIEQLNLLLREVIGRVVMLQAYTKGWLGARRYKRVREKREKGAIAIQSGKWLFS